MHSDISNFAFLSEHDTLLAEIASRAEDSVYDDPIACLMRLRALCEIIAQKTEEYSNVIEYSESQYERIESLRERSIIPSSVVHLLHEIRVQGNEAVHSHAASVDDALICLRDAYEIAVWFHQSFGSGSEEIQPGSFIVPEKQDTSHGRAQLLNEIEHLKNQANEYQQRLKGLDESQEDGESKSHERKVKILAGELQTRERLLKDLTQKGRDPREMPGEGTPGRKSASRVSGQMMPWVATGVAALILLTLTVVQMSAPAESDTTRPGHMLAEESPVEEPPVEESPVEESPVEEPPVEEPPVEEPPVEESPVEESPVEESPVEESPVEESPVEESPVERQSTSFDQAKTRSASSTVNKNSTANDLNLPPVDQIITQAELLWGKDQAITLLLRHARKSAEHDSLNRASRILDVAAEAAPGVSGPRGVRGKRLANIGVMFLEIGDAEKAWKVVEIMETCKCTSLSHQFDLLQRIAIHEFEIGKTYDSREAAEKAVRIVRSTPFVDRGAEKIGELAVAQLTVGDRDSAIENLDIAISMLGKWRSQVGDWRPDQVIQDLTVKLASGGYPKLARQLAGEIANEAKRVQTQAWLRSR